MKYLDVFKLVIIIGICQYKYCAEGDKVQDNGRDTSQMEIGDLINNDSDKNFYKKYLALKVKESKGDDEEEHSWVYQNQKKLV